jgi:hypothetical protein
VVELIDQDSNWWNLSLILEIFHEEEGRRICKIPLSHVQSKDVMIWCSTTNGEFSVRSAYVMCPTELRRGACFKQGCLIPGLKGPWMFAMCFLLGAPDRRMHTSWRLCL